MLRRLGARRRPVGVTIAEMLVYTVIAGLAVAAVFRVMIRQSRGYAQQAASIDVGESARSAAAMMAWDIRHAAMGRDTLLVLSPDSIVLWSVQGVGVVCRKHASLPRYAIWKTGGSIDSTINDSATVFRVASATWRTAKITAVDTGRYGWNRCAWAADSIKPDLAVELGTTNAADTANIDVGSAFRAFRKVTYLTITESGRTWLARRIGTGAYEKMTGPLRSSGGFELSYLDLNGQPTTTRSAVRLVRFVVRTESYRTYRDASGASVRRFDSVATAVALRP